MQAARDGQVEFVIVSDYSRLSRDRSGLVRIEKELNRLGVGILAVKPG